MFNIELDTSVFNTPPCSSPPTPEPVVELPPASGIGLGFGFDLDTSVFSVSEPPSQQRKSAKRPPAKAPRTKKRKRRDIENDEDLVKEMTLQIEEDLVNTKTFKKRENKRKYKSSAKMRKIADSIVNENSSQKGVGGKTANRESLEAIIERMVEENKQVDGEQLRRDILSAHEESDLICTKLQNILEQLVPTYHAINHYVDVLKRAENTMFGQKRTLINLSNALRRSFSECDDLYQTESTRSRNYLNLLARTESLARQNHSRGSGGSTRGFAEKTTAALVLYSSANAQTAVAVPETSSGTETKPVQFAVPLGDGRGLVEIRGTSAEQVMTGQIDSFLECSLARQGHAPVLTEEGELLRRSAKKQQRVISRVRETLEARMPLAAIHAAANLMLENESGAVPRITAK